MAARLTRAKKRIAESGVGIDLPDDLAVEERMPAVRRTIHLAYTMGHTAGSGGELRADDVADHAVRLARGCTPCGPATPRPPGCWPSSCSPRRAPPAASADRRHAGAARRRRPRARGTAALIAEGLALVAGLRPPPVHSACRPRSPPSTPAPRRSRPPTGRRSSASTTGCWRSSRARRSALGRCVAVSVPPRPGRRAGRPRRGARGRRPRALPVRPRRPGPAARAPRSAAPRPPAAWAGAAGARPHRRRARVLRGVRPLIWAGSVPAAGDDPRPDDRVVRSPPRSGSVTRSGSRAPGRFRPGAGGPPAGRRPRGRWPQPASCWAIISAVAAPISTSTRRRRRCRRARHDLHGRAELPAQRADGPARRPHDRPLGRPPLLDRGDDRLPRLGEVEVVRAHRPGRR